MRGANGHADDAPAPFVSPPAVVRLDGGEVHLWRARLDVAPQRVIALAAVLAPDEQERAGRFRAARDGARYTVAHGLLRLVLARYAGAPPGRLRFSSGPEGKPSLASGAGPEFNLTHAGGLALVAVSRAAVGVDVEEVRGGFDDVAERYFTTGELAAWRAAPAPERDRVFFELWTLKESYLKLTGRGLSAPLDGFEVTAAPGGGAAVRATRGPPLPPCGILHLTPAAGYVAAVARVGSVGSLRRWDADLLGPPPA